jgi:hypothetical protein
MASNKSRSENEVSWSTPPATQATTNLQGLVDKGADFSTPIRNAYARAEQNLSKSYQSPLGAYTTADVRDRALRSQKSDLQQSMGLDLSNAAQENAQGQFQRQATVAGLTAPQMYNSAQSQKFTAGDFLGMAFGGASSALM